MDQQLFGHIDDLVSDTKEAHALLSSFRVSTMDNPGWHVSASRQEDDPFQDKHQHWERFDSRYGKVVLIDGSRFDGYGDSGRLRELLILLIEACDRVQLQDSPYPANLQSEPLTRLCHWYIDRCDEDWEHQFGITFYKETGWRLEVDDYLNLGTSEVKEKLEPRGVNVVSEQYFTGWRTIFEQSEDSSLLHLIETVLETLGVAKTIRVYGFEDR
jgi:hypothetical protein